MFISFFVDSSAAILCLKFTTDWDSLASHKDTGNIATAISVRSTDRNTVLHTRSNHPKGLTENILYCRFLYLRRDCSSDVDFELKAQALQRESKVWKWNLKAKLKNRTATVSLTPPLSIKTDGTATFVSESNNKWNVIKGIITKHWKILVCPIW